MFRSVECLTPLAVGLSVISCRPIYCWFGLWMGGVQIASRFFTTIPIIVC